MIANHTFSKDLFGSQKKLNVVFTATHIMSIVQCDMRLALSSSSRGCSKRTFNLFQSFQKVYYKVWQALQSVTVTTKCDSYIIMYTTGLPLKLLQTTGNPQSVSKVMIHLTGFGEFSSIPNLGKTSPPPPCTMLTRHEMTIVPERVINIDWGGGNLANSLFFSCGVIKKIPKFCRVCHEFCNRLQVLNN